MIERGLYGEYTGMFRDVEGPFRDVWAFGTEGLVLYGYSHSNGESQWT